MKRLTAIILVLSIASVSLYAGLSVKVNSQKENLTFESVDFEGDRSYADGVKINLKSTYNHNILVFNTLYEFGSYGNDAVTTSFKFHKKPEQTTHHGDEYFSIDNPLNFGAQGSFDMEQYKSKKLKGIDKLLVDTLENTPVGSSQSKTIKLKDYHEFYPFRLNLTLKINDTRIIVDPHEILLPVYGYYHNHPTERALAKKLKDYIKIPVSQNDEFILNIKKDKLTDDTFSGEIECSPKSESQYCITSEAAVLDDAIYFTINNKDGNGKAVDTSLIPGGYGIYKIPYKFLNTDKIKLQKNTNQYDIKNQISFGDIETVFKLDEKPNVIALDKNFDGTKLHLLTDDNKKLTLTVIDIKTMTVTDTVTFGGKYSWAEQFSLSESYVIYSETREDSNYYTVISIDEKGNYTFKFSCKAKSYSGGIPSRNSMHFDGERLCHIEALEPSAMDINDIYPAGFFIEVYTKDGFKYSSKFISSIFTTSNKYENEDSEFNDFRFSNYNISFAY